MRGLQLCGETLSFVSTLWCNISNPGSVGPTGQSLEWLACSGSWAGWIFFRAHHHFLPSLHLLNSKYPLRSSDALFVICWKKLQLSGEPSLSLFPFPGLNNAITGTDTWEQQNGLLIRFSQKLPSALSWTPFCSPVLWQAKGYQLDVRRVITLSELMVSIWALLRSGTGRFKFCSTVQM